MKNDQGCEAILNYYSLQPRPDCPYKELNMTESVVDMFVKAFSDKHCITDENVKEQLKEIFLLGVEFGASYMMEKR